ncbi:MAG: MFS transporter [Proteobacteria bacterium]|nr:MFS transporter [Pseudomonadota bacterium]
MTLPNPEIESTYAWLRLVASFVLLTIGGVGMYAIIVAMPVIEIEFSATRSQASLPYSMIMLGWAAGTIAMGRLFDRFGIQIPILVGAFGFSSGFVVSSFAPSLWTLAASHGLLIGMLGTSSLFVPLMADVSQWFDRRRGVAVAIVASGQYVAGAIWPPVIYHFIETVGWRQAYVGIGIFCAATLVPLSFVLRRRLSISGDAAANARADVAPSSLGLSDSSLQILLCTAGIGCCIAMAMPQVHLVSMCVGLGFGPARGAEMLALMLGCGVVSRLGFGFIMDRLGGLQTLLIASALQCIALFFFLPFKGLVSMYIVSALFGLFQGGLVPCYAIIVREYFKPSVAGMRMGLIIMATLVGMALGGWLSGAIYDWTRSYTVAFINGIAWNFVNIGIVVFLLSRRGFAIKFSRAAT